MLRRYRKELNGTVRDWGNEVSPSLGDILTSNVNFKRVGATLGVIAPYVASGLIAKSLSEEVSLLNLEKDYSAYLYFVLLSAGATISGAPYFLGRTGYSFGKQTDDSLNNFKGVFKR